MFARTLRTVWPLVAALAMASPAGAIPHPPTSATAPRATPRRPARRATPVAQPATPPPPQVVAVEAADLQNTLRRLRIYVMNAPDGARAFGNLGAGPQMWMLLPSCRTSLVDDPRDPCPIERLAVDAVGPGGVQVGAMTTVMSGDTPRRVLAFVVAPSTELVRLRLITPQGVLHYEGAVRVDQLLRLPAPVGRDRDDGFAFDFAVYPAR
jgi:hypothetical protein